MKSFLKLAVRRDTWLRREIAGLPLDDVWAPNGRYWDPTVFGERQVASGERLELARPARLPEVDLFEARLAPKQLEPVEVRDANV